MSADYRTLTKNTILNTDTFIRATFKGQQKGKFVPWREVRIRPVEIKNTRQLQFSYLDSHKDITKNYADDLISEQLDQLLVFPFRSIYIETSSDKIQIQITKKGKILVNRTPHVSGEKTPHLIHDRQKEYVLPDDKPDAFLQAVGIMTKTGVVKTAMRDKFRQINAFLKLLDQSLKSSLSQTEPVNIVDFGCGNAYLSFAVYHYFNTVRNQPTHLTGVDVKADLLRDHALKAATLGWENMTFQPEAIIDYSPDASVDIALALHACDTATDEALYQAIRSESRYIFAAPCCHKHLHRQINQKAAPSLFVPVFQHGVLKTRTLDMLTDTFRAIILQRHGYKTDVMEFVSSEHTAKNLMIRAVKQDIPGQPLEKLQEAYIALKDYWGVTPYLETLLEK